MQARWKAVASRQRAGMLARALERTRAVSIQPAGDHATVTLECAVAPFLRAPLEEARARLADELSAALEGAVSLEFRYVEGEGAQAAAAEEPEHPVIAYAQKVFHARLARRNPLQERRDREG